MMKMARWSKCIVMVLLAVVTVAAAACSSKGTAQPTLTPSEGSIDIKSSPAGANVIIDGVDTGSITPYVATNIASGNHTVKLEYTHYKWRSENVSVSGGQTKYINWALTYIDSKTLTIQPDGAAGKDSYVNKMYPTQNYGLERNTFAGVYAADVWWRTYIQFDVSSLPSGAVIENASLELYYFAAVSTASAGPIGAYKVTSSWNESSITWNDQPTASSTATDTVIVPAANTSSFLSWNITALVEGWRSRNINIRTTNYGVMLRDADESTIEQYKGFHTSDETAVSERPKLVITYYIPTP